MKKIISLLLCALLVSSLALTGCNSNNLDGTKDPMEGVKSKASADKYRNYYQIFVHSFCDSNNDEFGDIPGIISQLDYLNDGDPNSGDDLGIDGLWLTPIMPSKSYHKYSVEDYYDIDPDFGTLDDFDKLVDECHKRGINIILDLVLNHISSAHPLFQSALEQVKKGNLDDDAQYFEFHPAGEFSSDTHTVPAGSYACEANFSSEMPEWNLNSEKTREEFKNIVKFWFDRGVDGFRLDACKFYTNKWTDGTEFLKWFCDACREINPDAYIVGETWSDTSDIEELYKSGIDSQFAFKFSQTSGMIAEYINTEKGNALGSKVMNYENKMIESNENEINAMFLSNHDQVRIANALQTKGLDYEKFAASVYMLFPGNSFTYYGEELGTVAKNTTNDGAYRTAMIFDSDNLPDIFVNGIGVAGEDYEPPEGGGVKQQLADENSLLNFYRRVINVKLQNPEIQRGRVTGLENFDDQNICAFYTEYNGSKVMIIHNFNSEDSKELTITEEMIPNAAVRADLVTKGESKHVTFNGGKLTMPPHSSVVIASAK